MNSMCDTSKQDARTHAHSYLFPSNYGVDEVCVPDVLVLDDVRKHLQEERHVRLVCLGRVQFSAEVQSVTETAAVAAAAVITTTKRDNGTSYDEMKHTKNTIKYTWC